MCDGWPAITTASDYGYRGKSHVELTNNSTCDTLEKTYGEEEAYSMTASFGALLRERRRAAGLTQRALAQRARLDFSYISKLENDRLPPPAADTIVLLCSILGVPAEDLLAFTHKLPSTVEEKVSANAAAQMFLREAQDLTEAQWQHLARRLHAQIDTRQKRNSMLPTRANAYDLVQWPAATMHLDNFQSLCVALFSRL